MLFSALLTLAGCSKSGPALKKDVLASVNGEPVFMSDLKREVALRARQDPTFKVTPDSATDQLNTIIDRKLIIQEAMEKGLAREERFVNTIKSFWEQTLIRDFFEYKKRSFQDYLFATDGEIGQFYDKLGMRVTFKVLKSTSKRDIDDAFKRYASSASEAGGWETIGPVGYEEISSSVLQDACDMVPGEVRRCDDPPYYYLIAVTNKDRVEVEPLERIKPEIEKRIRAMKERRLFDEWLKEKRKRSSIKVEPRAHAGDISQ